MKNKSRFTKIAVASGLIVASGAAVLGILFLTFAALALTQSRGWGFDVEAYVWAAQRIARGGSPYWEYTLEGPFNPLQGAVTELSRS